MEPLSKTRLGWFQWERDFSNFNVIDMKPKVLNCPYNTIFKAVEEISVRLVLGDILYANTIAGGIIFEDFVAVLYFSKTNVTR